MAKNSATKRPHALEPKAADTRDRILDSAAALIAERKEGVGEISVKDIASHAKVTTALVHAYFESSKESSAKNVIVATIYRAFIGKASDLMDLGLYFQKQARPAEKLLAILHATLRAFSMLPAFGRVVLKEMRDLDRDREEIKPIWAIFERVDAIIEEGQKKDEIVQTLDKTVIRQILFGVTQTLLSYKYLDAGRPPGGPSLTDDQIEAEVHDVLKLYLRPLPPGDPQRPAPEKES